jgi:hypothetical protein
MGVKGKEGSKQTKTWRWKTFSRKESKGNDPREKNPRCQNKSTRGVKRERGVAVRFPFQFMRGARFGFFRRRPFPLAIEIVTYSHLTGKITERLGRLAKIQ